MLTRYDLTLTPERPRHLRAEDAYALYAALLTRMPSGYAEAAHRDGVTPLSQYITARDGRAVWHISVLGGENEAALCPAIERVDAVELAGLRLNVAERTAAHVRDADELLRLAGRRSGPRTLVFETAAAFKSRGAYVNYPTPRLLLQNLLRRWNACLREAPVDDGEAALEALCQGLSWAQFRIASTTFRLKRGVTPGFTGELTPFICAEGDRRALTQALLYFASFSGVGIKTALGMGGVSLR